MEVDNARRACKDYIFYGNCFLKNLKLKKKKGKTDVLSCGVIQLMVNIFQTGL